MPDPLVDLKHELDARIRGLVDYLVTQPPKRLALQETRAFAWWAIEQGAIYPVAVNSRAARRDSQE